MADEIVRWARTARPIALALIASSSLALGLYLAGLLGSLVAVTRPVVLLTLTERWLVGVVAVAGAIGLGIALLRGFRRRWPSTPAVRQLDQLVGGSLLAGALALGGLELVAVGVTTYIRPDLFRSPRLEAAVLAVAGAVVGLELWRRRRA